VPLPHILFYLVSRAAERSKAGKKGGPHFAKLGNFPFFSTHDTVVEWRRTLGKRNLCFFQLRATDRSIDSITKERVKKSIV